MTSIKTAFKIAKDDRPGYEIKKAKLYKDYCVVFMQPFGTPNDPIFHEMDCYSFINLKTGKIEPHLIYEFEDFFTSSVNVRM